MKIFGEKIQSQIEEKIMELINSREDIIDNRMVSSQRAFNDELNGVLNDITSPRAVGNAIQDIIHDGFSNCVPENIFKEECNKPFCKINGLSFIDRKDNHYDVEIKIHNVDLNFHERLYKLPYPFRKIDDNWKDGRMQLTVEQLTRFFQDRNNYFVVLLLAYEIIGRKIIAKKCHFIPIEHININSFTILAQDDFVISNSIFIDTKQTRKGWMISLYNKLLETYRGLIDDGYDDMKYKAKNHEWYHRSAYSMDEKRDKIELLKKIKRNWETSKNVKE